MKTKLLLETAVAACVSLFGLFLVSCSENTDGDTNPPTYTLTTNAIPANGGNVLRSSVLTKYDAGTQITLTAAPNAGYKFTGWTGAPSGVNALSAEITFGINSDLTLTANFEALPEGTYAVTVVSAGTGATNSGNYAAGTTVTVSAGAPPAGQAFVNWTTTSNNVIFADANNATTSFIMPANAVTVTANFEALPTNPDNVIKAEPVAGSSNAENPEILGKWTDGNKNYYVIYVGYIRNTFISSIFGPEHYDGYHPVKVQMKEINTSTVTTSMTETVSNSIVVSNSSKINVGLEAAIKKEIKAEAGINKLFSVGTDIETSIKTNLGIEKTISDSKGKTTTTSINNITTYVESKETSREMTFGLNGAPQGYYRYALYSVSDVYFVISTSRDNKELLSWDVVSCPSDEYLRHNDYSPDGRFDNSPIKGSEIVFADDFYKNLPIPELESIPTYNITLNANGGFVTPTLLTAKRGQTLAELSLPTPTKEGCAFKGWYSDGGTKYENNYVVTNNVTLNARWSRYVTDTKTFSVGDNPTYSLPDDITFPATVEIWAGGAGGGGAGGSNNQILLDKKYILGAAGGGGAATYAKFKLESASNFNITVGAGGVKGNYKSSPTWDGWNYGTDGADGKPSTVSVGKITVVANGGNGGRGGTGGTGGKTVARPDDLLEYITNPGGIGDAGAYNTSSRNYGGTGGGGLPNPNGELKGGAGGNGGNNADGANGNDGKIIIMVTYTVEP